MKERKKVKRKNEGNGSEGKTEMDELKKGRGGEEEEGREEE